MDVCDWIYPKKTDFAFGRADNRPSIKFSTWDFGGQVRVSEDLLTQRAVKPSIGHEKRARMGRKIKLVARASCRI